MRIEFTWRGPPQLAARLGSRRSHDRAGTEQMNEEVKPAWRFAPNLIQRLSSHLWCVIPGLLDELASRGILESFVALHVSAGEEPFTSERPGGLLDEEDPAGVIDTRDDRTDGRPIGHVR